MLGSLEPCWAYVELMLGQEQRVPLGLDTRPKGTRLFGVMSGPLLGLCWTYLGPMLIHGWALSAPNQRAP